MPSNKCVRSVQSLTISTLMVQSKADTFVEFKQCKTVSKLTAGVLDVGDIKIKLQMISVIGCT